MFDRILDWIDKGWGWIKPFFIVDAFEKAAVLRFGVVNRAAEPGFHWKIPFCEQPFEVTACETTVRLPSQPLTTKDDRQVTVASIVKYKVVDVVAYVTKIHDQNDVLCDVTMGAIRRHIAERNYDDLIATLPEDKVATVVRRAVHKYGFEVVDVTFTAFTRARPIMLISPNSVQNLDN